MRQRIFAAAILVFILLITTFAGINCKASEIPATSLVVPQPNYAPQISRIIYESTTNVSAPVDITCKAIDPDGDLLTYGWIASSGNITGSGPTVIWISPSVPGIYTVTANVSDGRGGEDSESIVIEVTALPVIRPEISKILVTKMDHTELTVLAGDVRPILTRPWNIITLECFASDKNDNNLSYQWKSAGGKIEGTGSSVKFVPVEKEEIIVAVIVTNRKGLFSQMDIHFYADCCGHYPTGAREY
jgi:hypothetical protein